jgi:hypothetical protein
VETLEFFAPDVINAYGKPESCRFNMQEIKKHSHYDVSMKNDIAVTYTFASGRKLVLLLIEHWSDNSKFDIHRFAHYLIDLNRRNPESDILPIAFFTDRSKEWRRAPPGELQISCINEIYLQFKYRLIRLKDYQAEKFRDTKNRLISVLRSGMRFDADKKIEFAVELLEEFYYIEIDKKLFAKNSEVIDYFLELEENERNIIIEKLENEERTDMTIVQTLINRGIEKGIEKGREEGIGKGIERGAMEERVRTAKKMLAKGMSLKEIMEITELSPEEIRNIQ